MSDEQIDMPEDEPTEVPPFGVHGHGTFPRELESLINTYSMENGSDTPDFILAEYLKGCLENFDMCVRRREAWYGRVTTEASTAEDEQEG